MQRIYPALAQVGQRVKAADDIGSIPSVREGWEKVGRSERFAATRAGPKKLNSTSDLRSKSFVSFSSTQDDI